MADKLQNGKVHSKFLGLTSSSGFTASFEKQRHIVNNLDDLDYESVLPRNILKKNNTVK